jgi:outer membrane receptor protein involved in Fe transport
MDERDPSNAISVEERQAFWWRDVDAKMQLSPRLGIAYSISDNGVVHFSYGHFFQMPTYAQLYNNSRILINRTGGFATGFGNPDLDAERTIQYELGLKQEIFEGTDIEVTGFYRDSRDYVANAGIQDTYNTSINYQKNVNLAFAKTRGATIALSQIISRTFNFAIDYTYTRVEGSTTNFGALAANAIGPGSVTGQEQQDVWDFLILQGWDKPHILNTQLFYNQDTWGMNLTGQFQSGQPYTPFIPIAVRSGLGASQQDLTNLARLPNGFIVNLNAYKNFKISGFDAGFSVNVFNLLDFNLVTNVYGDSGEPDRPFFLPGGVVDPTFLNSPNNYGQPRRIQFSFNLSF